MHLNICILVSVYQHSAGFVGHDFQILVKEQALVSAREDVGRVADVPTWHLIKTGHFN